MIDFIKGLISQSYLDFHRVNALHTYTKGYIEASFATNSIVVQISGG